MLAAMMLGVTMIPAGCLTVEPRRVFLFEGSGYIVTRPPDVVAGITTTTNGIWLSRPSIELLQREKILP